MTPARSAEAGLPRVEARNDYRRPAPVSTDQCGVHDARLPPGQLSLRPCVRVWRCSFQVADHLAAMKIGDERDDAGTEGEPGGMSVGGRLGRDGIAAATTIGAVQVDPRRDRLDRRQSTGHASAQPCEPTPLTISPSTARAAPVRRWPGGRISALGNLQNPAYISSSGAGRRSWRGSQLADGPSAASISSVRGCWPRPLGQVPARRVPGRFASPST
jgi:hypothetical protein